MKPNFKPLFILLLFALFTFNSCQNEVLEETQNQEETISSESTVARLMRSTAANNGTVDNVLDGSDCFSINLPVTIIANGITITIDSLEDLDILQEIFDEFDSDNDFLEFLFPITIILNDHTEITIENEAQLEAFIEECTGNEDDVIECVDFVYPISFSIYNSAFQLIDTVVIESDEALYNFLEELEENPAGGAIIASLNYPVTLVYSDGSTVEVNSNQELQVALNAADELCIDDNDDDCTASDVEMYLLECYWNVVSFNGDDNFIGYDIYFNEDGTLEINQGGTTYSVGGHWEISETDAGLILSLLELTAFDQDLGGDWLIFECAEDRFKLIRENSTGAAQYVILERECENDIDCSAQQVNNSLIECIWYSGSNVTSDQFTGPFNFDGSGVVTVVVPNGDVITGQWNIVLNDMGIFLVLELPEPYNELSGEWKLFECDAHRLKFWRGDHYIVFEQDCQNDTYCDELQAHIGDECETADGVVGVINENCECVTESDEFDCPDYQANVGDPCENPNGVSGVLNENCDCVTDNTFDCEELQANVGDECEDANGNIGTLNENCECEIDTSALACFSNTEYVKCDDDITDGFTEFDLNMVYPNCPQDNVEITYHASLADAEVGVEALTSPYVNTSNPQTIYARIVIAGTTLYEVFEVHLYVEDCNPDPCTADNIALYLKECHWVPVSVDGSDDFSTVDLAFGVDGQLVAEGLGTSATGSWSVTGDPANGVYLLIGSFNNIFQVFTGEWLVAQCSETEMVLINNANNNQILLQRECN